MIATSPTSKKLEKKNPGLASVNSKPAHHANNFFAQNGDKQFWN
jgi:hypothetical protein